MKNFVNILISVKDSENYNFLAQISVYKNSCILNIFFEDKEMLNETNEIKDEHFLNIINAFLAYTKYSEYDLKNSDFSELHIKFVELIAYYIISYIFGASLQYNEIALIDLKVY